MFLRTLKVFLALVILALVTVLGYALSGRRGPGDALAEATELYNRGEYLRVVAKLNRDESGLSIQRDPNKLRDLWRLRYRAHQQLVNDQAALQDLDALLASIQEPDAELRLDHVRLLSRCNRGGQALREVREFLAAHPQDARALELAGEACQTIYQPELKAIVAGIDLEVDAGAREAARSAAMAWLYRPDGDVQVQEAFDELQRIYRSDTRTAAEWPRLAPRLRDLRMQVQAALGFFAQSLAFDGTQVAAFRGLALSLGQSQRLYDLLLLCEIYRRRFHHEYVQEAGATAANGLLRTGQDAAALATTLRWLPKDASDEAAAASLGDAAIEVLLARALAARRLADRAALDQAGVAARNLVKAGRPAQIASAVAFGLLQALGNDSERAEQSLAWATDLASKRPTAVDGVDLLTALMPDRIGNLQQHNAADPRIPEIYTQWSRQRPNAVEPLLGIAALHLANAAPAAAMTALDAAQKVDRTDPRILALRIEVAKALFSASEQDGTSLLRQCIGRRTELPDVPDPTGYVLCAEAALAAPVLPVAFACARAANEAFPWSSTGRVLEIRAALASRLAAEAVRLAEQAVVTWPGDPTVLALAIAAREANGEDPTGLLWRALAICPQTPHLSALVLRNAVAAAPAEAQPFLRVATGEAPTAELAILAARTLAREGKGREALARLRAIPATDRAADGLRADLAATALAAVTALATSLPDADVAAEFTLAAAEFGLGEAAAAPALFQAAADLEARAPQTAHEIATLGLAHAAPDQRNGAAFALAGRLALARGLMLMAEAQWTAAIAFADGRGVAEDLARLCFANGRAERGQQVYALATTHTDAALALRCGDLATARDLLATTLGADPSNFLAHATIAAAGLPSPYADLAPADAAARDELLTALSLLQKPGFARLALPTLAKLAADGSRGNAQMLLARAFAASGKGTAAAQLHQALFRRGFATVEFWREICEAAAHPDYPLDQELAEALGIAAAQQKLAASPYAVAFATARAAAAMTQRGHRELALRLMAPVWVTYDAARPFPANATPTMQDAEEVLASGRALDAWWILERLRPGLDGDDQDRCIDRMLELAERLTADPATRSGTLYAAVAELCDEAGARGRAVHFLLAHATTFPQAAPDRAATLALLHAHIAYAKSHPDEDAFVPRTVHELVAREGLEAARTAVEAALATQPAAVSMWLARTGLLCKMRRGPEAIAELRAVLRHCDSAPAIVELAVLAAAEGVLTKDDRDRLAACPKALLATPRGRLAQGLVALFGPRPESAIELLATPATGDEPLRLLALAQALLTSQLPDAEPRAAAVLQQLATDYTSSSEARYAGSFVLQLAPR